MAEVSQEEQPVRRGFLRSLLQNPVTVKELRSRMRGRRAFVLLTVYLLLMGLFITVLYALYSSASRQVYGPDPAQAGKAVYGAVLGVQVILVVFLGPAFTAAAISGEKERQTYDLLRTTLLPAPAFVLGKLISALSFVLLLILAALPLQSIAFLLGGVSGLELALSVLLVLVSAVSYSLLGLFFSSMVRSTLAASVITFASSLFMTLGIPALAIVFMPFISTYMSSTYRPWLELVAAYTGLSLSSINLPAAIIVSEIFLLQEDALFFWQDTVGGRTVWLFSPWWVYTILAILASLFLFWATVRRVRRIPNR
ncbi:MAG: ABC transporter permease [Anaerolineae bacterium]|nr:ABC transporter permease [Anaerolineae bacterium]